MSASTASIPFLSMVRSAFVETRSFTQRFSLGTQKRRSCRFGSQRRRVLLLACDTLLPDCARLPVTWQTLAIVRTSIMNGPPLARAVSAQRKTAGYFRCTKAASRVLQQNQVVAATKARALAA